MHTQFFNHGFDPLSREKRLCFEDSVEVKPPEAKPEVDAGEGAEKIKDEKKAAEKAKEKQEEAQEVVDNTVDTLHRNLEEQYKTISAILNTRLGAEDENAIHQTIVKPQNVSDQLSLIRQQQHMRELEKLVNAPMEWDVLPNYGKTDGVCIYMYKWDTEHRALLACTPQWGLQKLDPLTGTWSFVKPGDTEVKGNEKIAEIYKNKILPLNKNREARKQYDHNNFMEEYFLKRIVKNEEPISYADFNSEFSDVWTPGSNKQVQQRFELLNGLDPKAPAADEKEKKGGKGEKKEKDEKEKQEELTTIDAYLRTMKYEKNKILPLPDKNPENGIYSLFDGVLVVIKDSGCQVLIDDAKYNLTRDSDVFSVSISHKERDPLKIVKNDQSIELSTANGAERVIISILDSGELQVMQKISSSENATKTYRKK